MAVYVNRTNDHVEGAPHLRVYHVHAMHDEEADCLDIRVVVSDSSDETANAQHALALAREAARSFATGAPSYAEVTQGAVPRSES